MSTPFQNMHDADMKFTGDDVFKKGVYGKYAIERTDGIPMKNGFRFLLSPDNDPAALAALKTFQEVTENTELAVQLKEIILAIEANGGERP